MKTAAVVEVEPLAFRIWPDAAQMLGGLGRSTMYKLAADGEIETVLVQGCRVVPLDALRGYMDRLRAEQAA